MIVLVGASASGKTEAAKVLINKYGFKKMVTTTTRPMRVGERQDIDYHFITKEEFLKRKANNEFLETTEYNNNYYGTSRKDVSDDKVLIVEPEGANNIYEKLGSIIKIYFLEASESERRRHMLLRGDKIEDVERRIKNDHSRFDINKINHIDHIIMSDGKTITELADEIYKIHKK